MSPPFDEDLNPIRVARVEYGSKDHKEAARLREIVLLEPLGLTLLPEFRIGEEEAIHLAAFSDDRLIGALMLSSQSSQIVKMRQVAIDSAFQRQGIGAKLVVFSEKVSQALGFKKIQLSARDSAIPFYLSFGYLLKGKPYREVGILHQAMEKRLK